jgi:hypothetical protein
MCDDLIQHCVNEFEAKVDALAAAHRRGRILVSSPFFHERPVRIDDLPRLKLLVRNGLRAHAWFLRQGPASLQTLPLSEDEHENILCSGFLHRHLVTYYSYSLQARDFDYLGHPLFFDFARGVMADPRTEEYLREDRQLLEEFPPKPLAGLDERGCWRPLSNRASRLLETLAQP